nr:MAG: hypothetical protein 1 [Leviviridae sp.]
MGNKSWITYGLQYCPYTQYALCDGTIGNGGPITSRYTRSSFNRTGVDLPHWKQRVRDKVSATNPMSVTVLRNTFTPQYIEFVYGSNPLCPKQSRARVKTYSGTWSAGEFASNFSGNWTVPPELEAQATNIAATKFLKHLRATETKFSGPVMLGELRETLRMIRSPAEALRKQLDLFVKKAAKAHGKPGFKRTLAESWLENSFGWQPLIGDLASIAEAAVTVIDNPFRIVTGKGEVEKDFAPYDFTKTVAGIACVVDHHTTYRASVSVKYRAGIDARINCAESALERIIHAAGFNLNEVVPTAWELLPWSFLIDYFTNIGEVLSSWSTSRDSIRWAQKTVKRLTWTQCVSTSAYPNAGASPGSYIGVFSPVFWRSECTRYERALANVPNPGFVWQMPPIDSLKWLNIAALVQARRDPRNVFA